MHLEWLTSGSYGNEFYPQPDIVTCLYLLVDQTECGNSKHFSCFFILWILAKKKQSTWRCCNVISIIVENVTGYITYKEWRIIFRKSTNNVLREQNALWNCALVKQFTGIQFITRLECMLLNNWLIETLYLLFSVKKKINKNCILLPFSLYHILNKNAHWYACFLYTQLGFLISNLCQFLLCEYHFMSQALQIKYTCIWWIKVMTFALNVLPSSQNRV